MECTISLLVCETVCTMGTRMLLRSAHNSFPTWRYNWSMLWELGAPVCYFWTLFWHEIDDCLGCWLLPLSLWCLNYMLAVDAATRRWWQSWQFWTLASQMEAASLFETSDRVGFMEDSSISAKMTTVIYNQSNLKCFFQGCRSRVVLLLY